MTPDSDVIADDWFAEAFDALYPIIYAHRTVESARPESLFAARELELTARDRVLDLCCGNGRHMVHLLGYTPHVTGLDYSADLLRIARRQMGTSPRLVRADMRALPFHRAFDAVANFFTSFGYFKTDAENLAAARGIARALKPGGRFFIDYLNPPQIEARLEPITERDHLDYRIRETRWIDPAARRVNKLMTVEHHGVAVSRSAESVQLYTLDEMIALLNRADLDVERTYGDYDGAPLDDARPRMILVGRSRTADA